MMIMCPEKLLYKFYCALSMNYFNIVADSFDVFIAICYTA